MLRMRQDFHYLEKPGKSRNNQGIMEPIWPSLVMMAEEYRKIFQEEIFEEVPKESLDKIS